MSMSVGDIAWAEQELSDTVMSVVVVAHLGLVCDLLHRTASWRRNVSPLSYTFDC